MIDMGEIRGVITIITMVCFFGIFWWAYRRGNRARFEEDALIPFLDDDRAAREDPHMQQAGLIEHEESKNDE